MTCSVHKGDLPINITWLHNNQSIQNSFGVSIMKNGKKVSSLTIDSVSEEHAGVYICLAGNIAGTDERSAILNINGTFTNVAACFCPPFPPLDQYTLSAPGMVMGDSN